MGDWAQTHRRYELVHAVAGDVARLGAEGVTKREAEIVAEYGDLGTFLLDVQRRCHETAYAQLDDVVERGLAHKHVRRALSEAAAAQRRLWEVLRAFEGHPSLSDGEARFRNSVRVMTGLDPVVASTQTV